MASWAKNQIAKQLAKFAKNLDPNSLSLKFFKGECELNNLELDEGLLSDILEFPPWVQLTKVICNRISAKVPWTTLKTDPIKLLLDCVEVEIVASEVAREKSKNVPVFKEVKPSKYGFTEKVVDGMYISINTLHVSFVSLGFKASANISRIIIQSTAPDWRQVNNLRDTRIKDDLRGEVLTFKEIKWGTMRIDADASYKPESKEIPSTPLRFITNNSAIRLIIKKRMSDSSMIASKLAVILDDILWVLTRSQLLKLSSFVHYMIKLRSKFLPLAHQSAPSPHKTDQSNPVASNQQSQDQLFAAYDLIETSFHLRTHRIDLHLCDDSTLSGEKKQPPRSKYDESGAALQISIISISLDHCPYHLAGTKRSVIKADEEVTFQRMRWAHQLMNNFKETEGRQQRTKKSPTAQQARKPTMYESFIIASCRDFQIMQVTTAKSVNPQRFLSSEKGSLFLPPEMSAVHFDHTTYYYSGHNELPVPAPNLFVQMNPIQLRFDPLTCVWLNRFAQSVITGLDWTKEFMSREPGFVEHLNIRIEALMPKITIPIERDEKKPHADQRPTGMQIQISQGVISNCRIGAKCCQADLLNDLQHFIGSRLYGDMTCYPNEKQDIPPNTNASWLNDFSINHYQLHRMTQRDKELYSRLTRENNLPHQIWCIWCDQLWVEFTGITKAGDRPITFVDAFPLRMWLSQDVPYYQTNKPRLNPNLEIVQFSGEIRDSNSSRNQLSPNAVDPRYCSSDSSISTGSTGSSTQLRSNNRSLAGNVSPRKAASQTNSQTNFYESEYLTEEGLTNVRTSQSENDISTINRTVSQHHRNASVSDLDSNYAQGGPPPPYTKEFVEVRPPSVAGSIASLPPAYDALDGVIRNDEKVPITDFVDYSATEIPENASTAILIDIEKRVHVQIDHFQLLYLLRMGESFGEMSECIALDNELCDKERKLSLNQWEDLETTNKASETAKININIPEIIADIVLPPCVGIDPIQRLTVSERVKYDKECRQSNSVYLSDDSTLPMRTRKNSDGSDDVIDDNNVEADNIETTDGSDPYTQETQDQFDGTSLELRDIGIQSGDSCLKVNEVVRPENLLVSVLRIQGSIVTIGIQSVGDDSVVKVAMESMNLNELGNIKYGKIMDPRGHTVQSKDADKQHVNMNTLTGECVFKMRLISGPSAEQLAFGGRELGYADIRITSLCAALLMSTVDNLSEFGEDEFVLPTMPFIVNINQSDISLYDDKPRRYESAIKQPPMQVLLENLVVLRDSNGTISLNKDITNENNPPSVSYEGSASLFGHRDSALIAESINSQVDLLAGENDRLLEDLRVVNAKVNGLHNERESLLKVIDKLQQELMYSNRENDDLHTRVRSLSLKKQKGHFV